MRTQFETEGDDITVEVEIQDEMVRALSVFYRGLEVTSLYSPFELLKFEHRALKEYDRRRHDNVVRIKDRLED